MACFADFFVVQLAQPIEQREQRQDEADAGNHHDAQKEIDDAQFKAIYGQEAERVSII